MIPRLKAMLGEDRRFELEWISIYTFRCRRLARFRHGRVIFLGDAAHQVSPFGARGFNGGIQDADNLAWKLACVLAGLAPEALLDSYDEERLVAADENIRHSTRSTEFITPQQCRQPRAARRRAGAGRAPPLRAPDDQQRPPVDPDPARLLVPEHAGPATASRAASRPARPARTRRCCTAARPAGCSTSWRPALPLLLFLDRAGRARARRSASALRPSPREPVPIADAGDPEPRPGAPPAIDGLTTLVDVEGLAHARYGAGARHRLSGARPTSTSPRAGGGSRPSAVRLAARRVLDGLARSPMAVAGE